MNRQLNIIDLFLQTAAGNPERTAIIYKEQRVSFGDFKNSVIETAAYFKSKGIYAGDRVLVFVPMSIDLYRVALALFYMGATAVFLDEWVSKKRLEECCKIARCRAFVGTWKVRLLSFFSSELRKIPVKLGVNYKKNSGDLPMHETLATDTALITFTTGTTGTPKAAKRTHGFLKEQFDALIEKINPREGEVDMPALPIVLMINLGAGSTSVIPEFKAGKPAEMNAEKIWQQIKDHNVERIVSSPFFIKKISEYIIENNIATPGLQKIFTGGAPVFASEAAIYLKAFPGSTIEIVYGSTEAEPISSINAATLVNEKKDTLTKGLPVGAPYRKANVRIIKIISDAIQCNSIAELDAITLPDSVIGEIIVSGPHVLREYFNNDEALKQNKIFIGTDCWHRTGDSGYLENGKLYLTGRVNSLFEHNGQLITPFIYQELLQSIDGVVLGTVISHQNKLTAVIELKENSSSAEITEKILNSNTGIESVMITKIPRDPRHHSRVDFERLKKNIT